MDRFPEQNFSVICLCNTHKIGAATEQVADIFLTDQFKKEPDTVKENVADAPDIISIPEKELASLTGLYFDPITETTIRFYMEDGKLMIPGYVLSPLSQNSFKVAGAPDREIVFVRPIAGGPMQVKTIVGGKTVRARDAVKSETLTSAQLAEFTGKYLCDELAGAGATYTLSMKDGELVLEAMGRKDILLTPAFADVFFIVGLIQWYPGQRNDDLFVVKFMRNQQNAVTGFTLNRKAKGPRNMRFNKL